MVVKLEAYPAGYYFHNTGPKGRGQAQPKGQSNMAPHRYSSTLAGFLGSTKQLPAAVASSHCGMNLR